ncbi:MAG: tetratricopeptide repeat protein [SAR324 cluster bacterium]|nr:tetratricopeptide repeat protein [SAR324 cluster bacterium]
MRHLNFWILILLFLISPLLAVNAQEEARASFFVEGNQAYEEQDFAKAAKLYESVLQEDHANGHVYYNLGNTYYRMGKLGQALGYFLKAMQYLPRHEDIIANLQYVRLQTTDQKEDTDRSWRQIFNTWTVDFTRQEWIIFLVLCNTVFWIVTVVRLFYHREILLWLMILFGSGTVFLMVACFLKWWSPLPIGVILPKETTVYSAPHQQATVLFQLHEGAEVTIEEEAEDWVEIQFEPTKKGWVGKKSLFIIHPN